jgi:hypothetical protein
MSEPRVIFRGARNGRPLFDFGPIVAPAWLREEVAAGRFQVDGDTVTDQGRELAPGDVVLPP